MVKPLSAHTTYLLLLRDLWSKVADEEAVQFRTLNLMYGPLKIRGFPQPESCHPKWGDFGRAVESSSLNGALMKGTVLCSYGHGHYESGTGFVSIKAAAEDLMEVCSDNFLQDASERLSFDRGIEQDTLTPDDWLNSDAVQKRTPYVFWHGSGIVLVCLCLLLESFKVLVIRNQSNP